MASMASMVQVHLRHLFVSSARIAEDHSALWPSSVERVGIVVWRFVVAK
jgi:hypothetical protein